MVLDFAGISVTVNTATQEMLFSWMLFHKDAIKFKLDGKVFELLEHSAEKATVKVSGSGIEEGSKVVTIDNPFEWKVSDHADSADVDYTHSGDFCYIDRKGYVHIGTDLDGAITFSFKVKETNWTLEDVEMYYCYPEVTYLGVDEDFIVHFIVDFRYHKVELLYDSQDPLESVIEFID